MTTNDARVAERVRVMAAHGSARKYIHEIVGMNSRLDTVQAVVLNAKLRRLADWNNRRQAAAARYNELLADVPGVRIPRSVEEQLSTSGISTSSVSPIATRCSVSCTRLASARAFITRILCT